MYYNKTVLVHMAHKEHIVLAYNNILYGKYL